MCWHAKFISISARFFLSIDISTKVYFNDSLTSYAWLCCVSLLRVELIAVDDNLCENCSHFTLKWFQLNFFGEICFLEENYIRYKSIPTSLFTTTGWLRTFIIINDFKYDDKIKKELSLNHLFVLFACYSEFLKGFMDILRRQYGTRRILANSVYQEYIKDKDHYHMNATKVRYHVVLMRYVTCTYTCSIKEVHDIYMYVGCIKEVHDIYIYIYMWY